MRLIKFMILQILNIALSTIVGGTLSYLVLETSRKSYESNLYSSGIGMGFVFSMVTYIGYIIYRRVSSKGEHALRNELIFCYLFSILSWIIPLSLTFGASFDSLTDFGFSISLGTLCIPIFKHYFEPLLIKQQG